MDKEKAKRNLEAVLEKIKAFDSDSSLLHEYHKLYGKEIPLFKRSMAAAWLFMYYDQRETPNAQSTYTKRNAAAERPSAEINLSEEESKRLFISIGKNRRLFPREVISLIMTKTSTAREDIGNIRILDNYSFVQVRDTKADEIISALTGVKFRGRTLTVNYAKPKSTSDNEE
ncbi:MAG: DbpA RNA binding domain-containing protein [Treponema sp.]|nr:DbpA RNA binding domain-containing protein [Treponema sp.]